jgi:O-antigen ligase
MNALTTKHNFEKSKLILGLRNIFIYAFIFTLFIPGIYQSIFLGLVFVFTFFTKEFSEFKVIFKANKTLNICLFGLFGLLLVSLLIHGAKQDFFKIIETKLSLLIFPFFVPFFATKLDYKKMFYAASLGMIYMFCDYYYRISIVPEEIAMWEITPFAGELHPSYIAIISVLLFHLLFSSIIQEGKISVLEVLSLITMIMTVIFSLSKIGYLSLTLISLLNVIHLFRKYPSPKLIILVIIGTVGLSIFAVKKTTILDRFKESYKELTQPDPEIVMSTGERLIAWQGSIEVIKNNLLLGVGPGNEKDHLTEYYKSKNAILNAELKLDSHQQFFQTTMAAGILGGLLLLFLFVYIFHQGIKSKDYYILGFGIIFFCFALTESMLERQLGIVPFTFFILFLFQRPFQNLKISTFAEVKQIKGQS